MNIFQQLHLAPSQAGRRVGIARPRQSTHKAINAKHSTDIMPAKAATKRPSGETKIVPAKTNEETEADLLRMPDSSSDDEDSGDIKATTFANGSSKEKKGICALAAKPAKPAITTRSSLRDENGSYKGTSRLRASSENGSPSSSASKTSPKRKSPSDASELGAGMMDDHGRVRTKKAKQGYGSSQRSISSQKTSSQKSNLKKDTPKPKFNRPNLGSLSPSPDPTPQKTYQSHQMDGLDDSPESTSKSARNIYRKATITPAKEEKKETIKFQLHLLDDDDGDDSPSQPLEDSLPPLPKAEEKLSTKQPPATKEPIYEDRDTDESSLLKTLNDEKNMDNKMLEKITALTKGNMARSRRRMEEDELLSLTQIARCPMCDVPVDPEEIRAFGKNMNIRMQEKFCREHRMRTAKQDWEDNKYPTINWEQLDKRITQHQYLVKKIIKGGDSYYRTQMKEKVDAGKDRSLLTLSSNLTPGYYGPRGLRAISENIMHKFTPLLKKRMVEDELMSARGVTPYVQHVLVPEVTSRLIMEDMKVDIERAREIIEESADAGDLLNEELRDVVRIAVSDSEDDDEDDGY